MAYSLHRNYLTTKNALIFRLSGANLTKGEWLNDNCVPLVCFNSNKVP